MAGDRVGRARARRRRWLHGVLAGAAVVVTTLTPTTAWAHTDLVSGTPGPGTVVHRPPAAVRLVFTEPVTAAHATVSVRSTEDMELAAGRPVVSGTGLAQALGVLTERGRYTVRYRVVARDGHPVTGEWTFRFRPPKEMRTAPDAAARGSVPAPPVVPPPADNSPSTGAAVAATPPTGLLLGTAGVGLAVALGALGARSRRRATKSPR